MKTTIKFIPCENFFWRSRTEIPVEVEGAGEFFENAAMDLIVNLKSNYYNLPYPIFRQLGKLETFSSNTYGARQSQVEYKNKDSDQNFTLTFNFTF